MDYSEEKNSFFYYPTIYILIIEKMAKIVYPINFGVIVKTLESIC